MSYHDILAQRAVTARDRITKENVANAFVGSLTSRNLLARSSLGAWAVLEKFQLHPFTPCTMLSAKQCQICGGENSAPSKDREKYHSPEIIREMKGKYSPLFLPYAVNGLEMMAPEDFSPPGDDAVRILRAILDAIRALPDSAQLTELEKSLTGILMSNKLERIRALEIFGFCSILRDPGRPAFHEHFVGYEEMCRYGPDHFYKRDWAYPIQNWTGNHGVDEDRVRYWFSHLL